MLKKPKIEHTSRSVLTLRFDDISAGWEFWALLRSDAHHDSPHCDRNLERRHLEMAKERGALIFDFGDTFDAMQGKFDPRRSMEDVRPEDKTVNYYGSIVDHAAEDYAPFADNWALFAKGNHETAVLDKANICIMSNLVKDLNSKTGEGHKIAIGGTGGWVRFMFSVHGNRRQSIKLAYNHGSGGNAPVTRGVIATNRQAVFLPDADIVVNGHNHQSYILPIARERLTNSGRVTRDLCWYLRTPGYKDEWQDGHSGYAVEKNMGPTTNGSIWLHFTLQGNRVGVKPIPELV